MNANFYYYNPTFECWKRGIKNEIRVYNRLNTSYSVGKTSEGVKTELKNLGFKWDNQNKSYYLENASEDTEKAICEMMSFQVKDYNLPA